MTAVMGRLAIFLILTLAACDTPSPPMMAAESTRLSVAGHVFTVRHDAGRAEAVRTSPMPDPGLREMLSLSKAAIEAASGCAVRDGTLYGDRVMAEALLDCAEAAPLRLGPPVIFDAPPR